MISFIRLPFLLLVECWPIRSSHSRPNHHTAAFRRSVLSLYYTRHAYIVYSSSKHLIVCSHWGADETMKVLQLMVKKRLDFPSWLFPWLDEHQSASRCKYVRISDKKVVIIYRPNKYKSTRWEIDHMSTSIWIMKRELRVHSASVFQQFPICGINPALFSSSSQLLLQQSFILCCFSSSQLYIYNYMSSWAL